MLLLPGPPVGLLHTYHNFVVYRRAALCLGQTPKETFALGFFNVGIAPEGLSFPLFDEHSVVDADCRKARSLAEPLPVAGKVHTLAVPDKIFQNPNAVASGPEYLVTLRHNLGRCGPKCGALLVAKLI